MTTAISMTPELVHRLDNLAKAFHASRSSLVSQAVEEFLALQEWQVAAIQSGIAAADRGELHDHAKATAILESWGKPHAD